MTQPTITGLTERECWIADLIWSMDSEDQIRAFIQSLPPKDRRSAQAITAIMIYECMEEQIDDYKELADTVIDQCR